MSISNSLSGWQIWGVDKRLGVETTLETMLPLKELKILRLEIKLQLLITDCL